MSNIITDLLGIGITFVVSPPPPLVYDQILEVDVTFGATFTKQTANDTWANARTAPADSSFGDPPGITQTMCRAANQLQEGNDNRTVYRMFLRFDLNSLSLPSAILGARIVVESNIVNGTPRLTVAEGISTLNDANWADPLGTPIFAGPSEIFQSAVFSDTLQFTEDGLSYLNAQSSGYAYLAFLDYDHDWLNVDPSQPTIDQINVFINTGGKKPTLEMAIG
jgi:hypothetical protein